MQQTQSPHSVSGLHGCRMDSRQHLFSLLPPGTLHRPSSLAGTGRGSSPMRNVHPPRWCRLMVCFKVCRLVTCACTAAPERRLLSDVESRVLVRYFFFRTHSWGPNVFLSWRYQKLRLPLWKVAAGLFDVRFRDSFVVRCKPNQTFWAAKNKVTSSSSHLLI